MTPNDLMWRVTRDVCALGAALAVAAAWVAGVTGVLGVAAGLALAIGNFRWLVSRVCAPARTPDAARVWWSLGAGLRLAAFAAGCAALFASGWVHPVAFVIALTTLPCAVVGHGLRAAREEH
jgi:ATP synthase I chain